MATPAERQALLFIAAVALLGVSVRLWRTHHQTPTHTTMPAVDSLNTRSERAEKGKKHKKSSRTIDQSMTLVDDPNPPLVDLDVASIAEIDAIGVLHPGQARQIVRDRDSYGPFGSIQGLERIPYFPKSAITKLAPRVTFSRVPRPSNAVIQRRPDSAHTRRTRRRHLDVAP